MNCFCQLFLSVSAIMLSESLVSARETCGILYNIEYYCLSGTHCCGIRLGQYQCCSSYGGAAWYIWVAVAVGLFILTGAIGGFCRRRRLRKQAAQNRPQSLSIQNVPAPYNVQTTPPPNNVQILPPPYNVQTLPPPYIVPTAPTAQDPPPVYQYEYPPPQINTNEASKPYPVQQYT